MIKYAIPIIFLICMTAYESSAANAALKCDNQFIPQSKVLKKPWIERKYFAELLAYFKIATYKQYRGFPRNIFRQEAEKRWGEGFRIPRDPMKTYGWNWREILNLSPSKINWIKPKKFAKLLRKLGLTRITEFNAVSIEDLNKEAEKWLGERVRVPRDPVFTYEREWEDVISGKSREEQRKLTYQESLSLDLPEFIKKYLSKTIITELNLDNKEIEELFGNFQYGMELFNKKKFRRAFDFLPSIDAQIDSSKLKKIIKDLKFALDEHTEELNKTSIYDQNDEAA